MKLILNRYVPEADEVITANEINVTNVTRVIEFTPGFRHITYKYTTKDGEERQCWDDQYSKWVIMDENNNPVEVPEIYPGV